MSARNLLQQAENLLWGRRDRTEARWKTGAQRLLQTLAVIFRDVTQGQLTLRAMGLVYTTLLSLVPLLALSFSVLKAFGVHNQIQPLLQRVLAPLGADSGEVTDRIIGFIGNMNVGVLGSVGLALLIYTALSLIEKVEESFNYIWHVARSRSFGERFSRYLSLLLIGPLLVFSALGITATVVNAELMLRILTIEPFGRLFVTLSGLMPYFLIIAAFTFAYHFVPNTRVRPAAALLGGIVAGSAWQTAGWGFALFAASSGSYEAIYSGFAILILFLIWLYLSWLILLVGASVSFYAQHPEYLTARSGEPRLSNRMRERLAFGAMSLLAERFLSGQPPLSVDELAQGLRVPGHAIQLVLDALERRGLVTRTGGETPAYLPARDLATISLHELLDVARSAGEERYLSPADLPLQPEVDQVLTRVEAAVDGALSRLSLKDIAAEAPAPLADAGAHDKAKGRPA